ncbi:MAG: response regulator transcription factor [Candidatus Nanopelagicales bacterium]
MSPDPLSVAIVDDHALVREGLAALLAGPEAPAEIVVVYSGMDCAEAASSGARVALLDINLGDGGRELVGCVQQLRAAGIAVVLVSEVGDTALIRDGIEAGALGFVPKASHATDLAEAMAAALRGELSLTPALAAALLTAPSRPQLSPRELTALRLYASGLKIAAVARRMDVSPYTVKEYLDRVRDKYAAAGREARTRTQLFAAAQQDGLLEPDTLQGGPDPDRPTAGGPDPRAR